MKPRVLPIAVLALCCVVLFSAEKPDATTIDAAAIGRNTIIQGELELPVGKVVTVSGKMTRNGPLVFLKVDMLNGKKLAKAVELNVDGTNELPRGTSVTATGYERGTLRYLTADDTNVSPDEAERFVPYQHLFLEFVPTKKLQIERP